MFRIIILFLERVSNVAQFKILRGLSYNIPSIIDDGCIYFCTDTGNMFIDYINPDGYLRRRLVNAEGGNSFVGFDITEEVLPADNLIPTARAVYNEVSQKSQVQIITWGADD